MKIQQNEVRIYSEIDRIINCIHKNPSEELKSNVYTLARKVLTDEARTNSDSLEEQINKITTNVASTHDRSSLQQCQDILQRYSKNQIQYKQEVLSMLLKLSEINNQQEEDVPIMLRSLGRKDFHISSQIKFSHLSQTVPVVKKEEEKVIKNRRDIKEGKNQSQLVQQLLFVFTNRSSSQIIQTFQGYQLKNSIHASTTVQRMISHIADLGWLHQRIARYSEKQGAIRKALWQAIQQQLKEYYIWNNTMEGLIKENKLSLRKLYIWSFHPQQVLKWLAILLDAVQPFHGCHIISIVNSYRPHGLTAINGLINRILSYIIRPLLTYIQNWVYMGVLLDEKNEFFISENKLVSLSEEWHNRFQLLNENIPSILNRQSAKMIFNTGKSIYFLKNKCNKCYNIQTEFIDTNNIQNLCNEGTNALISTPFMNWLITVHNEVNNILMETLFNHFHLKYHLQSIKHFFLAGKGDFIQQLYDILKENLSSKKDNVNERALNKEISDAIAKCFNDFLMPDKVNSYRNSVVYRLSAQKINFGNGGQGWDCFNFQYSLQNIQPLQAVFKPQVMLNYQKIFNFLWKVKKIKEILNHLWFSQSRNESMKIKKTRNINLNELFHVIYLLRNSMTHFATNLHSYLMVAIESSWNKFWEQIDSTNNFDDLLNMHKQFQQEILEITLITPRYASIQVSLNNIFTVINNFRIVYQRLQQNFDEYYDRLRIGEDRHNQSKRSILNDSREIPEFDSSRSCKDIKEIKSCFDAMFKNLYMQISKEASQQSKFNNLNVLLAKSNFSQYYSNLYMYMK